MKRFADSRSVFGMARLIVASAFMLASLRTPAQGEPLALPVALPNMQVNLSRLAGNAPTALTQFQVDADTINILILITASRAGVVAGVEIPSGTILSSTTVGSVGGDYQDMIGGAENGGLLMMLGNQPGFHQLFDLPSQGPGPYKIRLANPPGNVAEVAVITTVLLDGRLRATLFAADAVVPLGSSVALHAALFDGAAAVTNATVSAFLKAPSGSEAYFSLLDNGVGADYEYGDGLYSALYLASEPGVHRVTTELIGASPSGLSFSRKAGTTFRVVGPCAVLTGSVSDFGEDDDVDGVLDRLSIEADVQVASNARLSMLATVETPSGKVMAAHGAADLPAGLGFLAASIDASTIWENGEDGPYVIRSVVLYCHGPDGPIPADRDLTLFQTTAPYVLTQFRRPPIRITGVVGEQTMDFESDGDADALAVTIGVEAATECEYSFAARLMSSCGHELGRATGSAVLPSYPSEGAIVLAFDGSSIGSSGLDGPYHVAGLGIWGCGASVYRGLLAETQSYLASEFNSFAVPPDCNVNGHPDVCDLASSGSPDCNANGTPDECDVAAGTSPDCNANTVPDACDMAMGRESDTNANGIPDGCEVNPPLPAPYPHDRAKNRYISFDSNKAANDGRNAAFRVTLRALQLGSCDGNGAPCRVDTGGPNEPGDADCKVCDIDGNPCFEASWDCNPVPRQNCITTGESCVNDRTLAGLSNVGMSWWVGPKKPEIAESIHLLVSEPFRMTSTDWAEVVHVGDCEIVPMATYGVATVDTVGGVVSAELVVQTIRRPIDSDSWWCDVVGALSRHCGGDLREPVCGQPGDPPCPGIQSCALAWGLPDGVVNFDDITAILAVMAPNSKSTAAEMTWVDVHGNDSGVPGSQSFDPPNYVANLSDIAVVLRAFAGLPYPYHDPGDCPDTASWP